MVRKQITVGHRSVSYLEAGSAPGDRPRGVLLLAHAFPLSAEMWRPQLEAAPHGWRVLAIDLPGFGGSTLPLAAPSLDEYAGAMIDLMDALHVGAAVIGGLSMGGYATFALLRHAPQYVSALVLADTRATADTPEARLNRQKMLELARRDGAAGVADEMLPKLLAPSTLPDQPALRDRIRALILECTPESLGFAITSMMNRPDSTGDLASIRCPTLILVGAEDALTPISDAEALQRQIAGAVLEIISDAGHLSSVEQPQRFNAALAKFLANQV